jgi:hypothetical protein
MTISTRPPARDGRTPETVADRRASRTTLAAYTALGWVVLFFACHVYWYLGGSVASPGKLLGVPHSPAAWIVNVVVTLAFPLGALVCLAVARGWARGRLAPATRAAVRIGCTVLLLRGAAGILDDLAHATGILPNGITGLSLEDTTGHAGLRWSDWAIDAYFLAGGIIFWNLAVHRRAPRPRGLRLGREGDLRSGSERGRWSRRVHRGLIRRRPALEPVTQRPVAVWAERLAHAIPFLVLPSGLWRLAAACGFSMGNLDDAGEPAVIHGWAAIYLVAVTLLSETIALSGFGLVRPWGEVVPAWLPFIGGRRVRPRTAVVAATLGAVALMLIWTVGFWDVWTGAQAHQMASPFWADVFAACYAPLNLWGPALLALTWAYHRRRAGLDRG